MSKLAGILWDMDGTLVDSGDLHFQSWLDTLPKYGLSISRELFNETFGMRLDEIIRVMFQEKYTPELVQTIGAEKEASFRESMPGKLQPLPGVKKLIKLFKEANIPQAVASSAPQENVDAIMAELNFSPDFQAVVCAVNMPGKPDPSVFLAAAKAIQALPQECIVIEDATHGIEAAKRAGMKCVAVTSNYPAEKLAEADIVVDRLGELGIKDFEDLINQG
jgi:HAD superfamily hydrolase (TIGR01509 family)